MWHKRGLRKLIDAIERGATTVEEIHKSIAELPLKAIEQSDLLLEPAQQIERWQNRTLSAAYDTIRGLNLTMAFLAHRLLSKPRAKRCKTSTRRRRATPNVGLEKQYPMEG